MIDFSINRDPITIERKRHQNLEYTSLREGKWSHRGKDITEKAQATLQYIEAWAEKQKDVGNVTAPLAYLKSSGGHSYVLSGATYSLKKAEGNPRISVSSYSEGTQTLDNAVWELVWKVASEFFVGQGYSVSEGTTSLPVTVKVTKQWTEHFDLDDDPRDWPEADEEYRSGETLFGYEMTFKKTVEEQQYHDIPTKVIRFSDMGKVVDYDKLARASEQKRFCCC